MNNKFIVYSHVNKVTNVTYVGITKRKPELRWANGFGYRTNPYFWRAMDLPTIYYIPTSQKKKLLV